MALQVTENILKLMSSVLKQAEHMLLNFLYEGDTEAYSGDVTCLGSLTRLVAGQGMKPGPCPPLLNHSPFSVTLCAIIRAPSILLGGGLL